MVTLTTSRVQHLVYAAYTKGLPNAMDGLGILQHEKKVMALCTIAAYANNKTGRVQMNRMHIFKKSYINWMADSNLVAEIKLRSIYFHPTQMLFSDFET